MKMSILITVVLILVNKNVFPQGAGDALQLDGVDGYVQCLASSSLNTLNAITLEAWIKPRGSSAQPVIEYNNSSKFGVHLWQFFTFDQLMVNFVDVGGFNHGTLSSKNQFTADNWYHVSAMYDKVSGFGDLYINGRRVASRNHGSFDLSTSYDLYFGKRIAGGRLDNVNFNGIIDEVRVWNSARTQRQIQENMLRYLSKSDSGLVGYWQFNQDHGKIVLDSGGSENHGMIQGNPTWLTSTGPFGNGISNTQIVTSTDSVIFAGTDLLVSFTSKSGIDTIVVTKIQSSPGGIQPPGVNRIAKKYWIVEKYSDGTLAADLIFTLGAGQISTNDQNTPSNPLLFSRGSNSDKSWTEIDTAASAVSGL